MYCTKASCYIFSPSCYGEAVDKYDQLIICLLVIGCVIGAGQQFQNCILPMNFCICGLITNVRLKESACYFLSLSLSNYFYISLSLLSSTPSFVGVTNQSLGTVCARNIFRYFTGKMQIISLLISNGNQQEIFAMSCCCNSSPSPLSGNIFCSLLQCLGYIQLHQLPSLSETKLFVKNKYLHLGRWISRRERDQQGRNSQKKDFQMGVQEGLWSYEVQEMLVQKHPQLWAVSWIKCRLSFLFPEFQKIAVATAIGFCIMGFIGFFVKLIHIPINNIIV